ncbi:MAG TPA: hypothetical protein GXX36_08485 [Clostridiaceae bacterium]|nr:hypothetical protein [Clostridiaceae bacterium]
MNYIFEQIKNQANPVPCLFYPMAKKMNISVSDVLSDGKKQAQMLIEISKSYPVSAVIRMTELWCEAASFGMECNIAENGFPKLGSPLYTDIDELPDASVPQIVNDVTGPLIEAVELAVPHMDTPLIVGVTGPYTLASVLNGSENFMINCMTEPDDVHIFLEKITDFLIAYISAYKAAGASAVILAEPSVAMISPAMTDEFSNKYIQNIISKTQDESFSIIYHNCGAVNSHIDTILELDADGFHFGSEVNLDYVFKKIGNDKLVMGNIDPRLFISDNGTVIEKTIKNLQEKYSAYDNWRLSTGCDLAPNVFPGNIELFFEAATK